jgi:hypothetical protein
MMLSDLQPVTLTRLAQSVGVDPFTAVRLLVASDGMPRRLLQFDAEAVERVQRFALVEPSWWDDMELDDAPLEEWFQVAMQLMLERGHVGERAVPRRNVVRGLDRELADQICDGIEALTEEGHLAVVRSPIGMLIAVQPGSQDLVRRIGNGQTLTPGLEQALGVTHGA